MAGPSRRHSSQEVIMKATDVLPIQRCIYEEVVAYERTPMPTSPPDYFKEKELRLGTSMARLMSHAADAFFVSSEMTNIAETASKSLPEVVINGVEELPSDKGFIVFERPLKLKTEAGVIIGYLWAAGPTSDGPEPGMAIVPVSLRSNGSITGFSGVWCKLVYGKEVIEWGDYLRPLISAISIMQQKFVAHEVVPTQRAERRRWARLDANPSDVVVVRVRKREAAAHDSAESSSGIEWSHRWLVSGHWRQQPYGPGRISKRQTWIPSYVKGPEDKPLVVKDRVTAWVR